MVIPSFLVKHPLIAPLLLATAALATALFSQYVLGTHPCELCILQRYPYLAVIGLCAAGWLMRRHGRLRSLALILSAIAFVITGGTGAYHFSVEKGWVDAPSGCAVDMSASASLDDLRAQIMNAPLVSCADVGAELFGLSMPLWNAAYGLFAAGLCIIVWRKRRAA